MKKKGLHRDTIDKFYTNPETVRQCLSMVKQHVPIHKEEDLLLEPSAGNGAFLRGIQSLSHHCLFYDIDPEHDEILQQDFLLLDEKIRITTTNHRKIHVIGNPPFGRQSSIAIKFIKKACSFCDTVSFILPRSFKKESLKRAFPMEFHLVAEMDLPPHSFLVDQKEHDVPCIFQVWIKKPGVLRYISPTLQPYRFEFVKKTDNPHISFRRVGINAGVIDTHIYEKNIQSHYFLKFTHEKPIEEMIARLSEATFDDNNTVGPRSISKQEVMAVLNPILASF